MMGKGLGLLGVAVSAGFIAGPVAGGFLLDYLDWRAIFYARVPLSILAFILAIVLLKKDTIRAGKIKLDLLGAVASCAGLFCFLFGIGQIKAYGLKSPVVVMLAGAGLLMLCLLPFIERRAQNPIIDFGLFENRDFTYAMAGFFVFFLTMPVYILLLPFYLMEAIKLTASDSGLLLSVLPVTTMIASPISGALSDRFGPRWPSALGAGAVAVAFFCMFQFNLQTEIRTIVLVLALLGIGSGVFQPPNNSTIMGAVDPKYHGSASAMIATNRQVAMSIGLALTGIIFSDRQIACYNLLRQEGVAANVAFNQAIPSAFGEIVFASFFLTLIVLGFSLLSPKRQN